MKHSSTQSGATQRVPTAEEILALVQQVSTELWCVTDLTHRRVLRCSVAFSQLWQRSGSTDGRSVDLTHVEDLHTIERKSSGPPLLPPLAQLLAGRSESSQARPTSLPGGDDFNIRRHVILDQKGLPVGTLIMLIEPARQRSAGSTSTERAPDSLSIPLSLVSREIRDAYRRLSPREKAVADLLYEGDTNGTVAMKLEISSKTVEKHRSSAMQKMGVRNFATLIRLLTLIRLESGREPEAMPEPHPESDRETAELDSSDPKAD